VDSGSATVSGLSSGAYQAVQLHVSWSETFHGMGALAGGPYWCAQDDVLLALGECMTDGTQVRCERGGGGGGGGGGGPPPPPPPARPPGRSTWGTWL
jgi:hypothetical protein